MKRKIMQEQIRKLIHRTVQNILNKTAKKKSALIKKHKEKVHFIPIQYRVFGGMLQSMNIQFGNFLEEMMRDLIQTESHYQLITKLSGQRKKSFQISAQNSADIDKYIEQCQISQTDGYCNSAFPILQQKIIQNTDCHENTFIHDIDLLFQDKESGIYYYLEIKYNDDHDTGKFVDINRKFIKTYAYLVKELHITDVNKLKPILFFFNNKRMKGNIYLPEKTNIYRGEKFFKEFLSQIEYQELNNFMMHLSQSDEIKQMFDSLYQKTVFNRAS